MSNIQEKIDSFVLILQKGKWKDEQIDFWIKEIVQQAVEEYKKENVKIDTTPTITLHNKIDKCVDFMGFGFSEEGKKQLRETYEAVARQATKEERMRILDGLPKDKEKFDYDSDERGFSNCLSQVKSLIQKDN